MASVELSLWEKISAGKVFLYRKALWAAARNVAKTAVVKFSGPFLLGTGMLHKACGAPFL